jgi:hypothetical protein
MLCDDRLENIILKRSIVNLAKLGLKVITMIENLGRLLNFYLCIAAKS